MIYTVTLNPSVDYIVHVEDFTVGGLNRSSYDTKYPGGQRHQRIETAEKTPCGV